MAKRRGPSALEVRSGRSSEAASGSDAQRLLEAPTTEDRIEEFAEDLGRLLGSAKVKAQGWLDQRKAIAAHLTGLRDTANQLLEQLGVGRTTDGGRRPGRPRKAAAVEGEFAPPPLSKMQRRKRRTMSAEAREKIAAAQRARWAKVRKAAKG
jgi:hypothetical protein